MGPYHEGFADLLRRCTPPRDLVKEAVIRKQLTGLRAQLKVANAQLAKRFTPELDKKANELARNINSLQAQIDLYELNVANAIWGEKTYPFEGEYLQTVGRFYGPGLVRDADFINDFPAERLKINHWVEMQTKDKIKDLIPKMDPQTARLIRMILVNAIYFKGQWQEPFKKKFTKEEAFHLPNDAKSKAALMRQHMPARYAAFNADGSYFETPRKIGFGKKEKTYPDAGGFLIAELPYKGNRLAMTILLPRSPNGLAALEKQLTGDMLTRSLSRLQNFNVQVTLPKFKMETTYELGEGLKKLGMKKAFTERVADFGGMSKSSDKLYISRVIHKAFVDVNEEGTEAAAATAVIMALPTSAPATFPFVPDFRADRPFVFLIREVDTGAILFMGRMTTPTK
jgi:serine protease inhibitor